MRSGGVADLDPGSCRNSHSGLDLGSRSGLGSGLGKAFNSGEPIHLSIIFAPHVILPLLGLALLSLAPVVLSRLRRRSTPRQGLDV